MPEESDKRGGKKGKGKQRLVWDIKQFTHIINTIFSPEENFIVDIKPDVVLNYFRLPFSLLGCLFLKRCWKYLEIS